MRLAIPGFHHVTAIASDPQTNLDFYVGVLGLRLVKITVNFDDPSVYHFYYGDGAGTPGSILTFFPFPGARRGSRGVGQVTTTTFAVAETSLGFWRDRFRRAGVIAEDPRVRRDRQTLRFADPDGLRLELVGVGQGADLPLALSPWEQGPVPVEHGLQGFAGVTLELPSLEATAGLLTEGLSWSCGPAEREGEVLEVRTPSGATVSLSAPAGAAYGRVAAGSVHHVAFRVEDDEAQEAWRLRLLERGLGVSEVKDRQYFHSIYFREPGGVLFELATERPGFALDEPLAELGRALQLPPWLEERRGAIEGSLPKIRIPEGASEELP